MTILNIEISLSCEKKKICKNYSARKWLFFPTKIKNTNKNCKFVVRPCSRFTENQLQEKFRKAAHRYHFFSTDSPKRNYKSLQRHNKSPVKLYGGVFLFFLLKQLMPFQLLNLFAKMIYHGCFITPWKSLLELFSTFNRFFV